MSTGREQRIQQRRILVCAKRMIRYARRFNEETAEDSFVRVLQRPEIRFATETENPTGRVVMVLDRHYEPLPHKMLEELARCEGDFIRRQQQLQQQQQQLQQQQQQLQQQQQQQQQQQHLLLLAEEQQEEVAVVGVADAEAMAGRARHPAMAVDLLSQEELERALAEETENAVHRVSENGLPPLSLISTTPSSASLAANARDAILREALADLHGADMGWDGV